MKELRYQYHLEILFSEPAREHRFTVKSFPQSDERQEISDQRVEILPNEFLCDSRDSFGNLCVYGNAAGTHDRFRVYVEGRAKTGLKPWVEETEERKSWIFKYPSRLTRPGAKLMELYQEGDLKKHPDCLSRAEYRMNQVHDCLSYEKGVTNISTTAEEAAILGAGVCQDFSHVMIALLRMDGIPARYVVGMMLGEGESHAWVEVLCGDRWYGLDPTNLLMVSEDHIKISCGRDYGDCILNQGVFIGGGTQTQTVQVKVIEENR